LVRADPAGGTVLPPALGTSTVPRAGKNLAPKPVAAAANGNGEVDGEGNGGEAAVAEVKEA
jgi:hypothetical protein